MISTKVTRDFVEVKFSVSLKVSSISKDNFRLYRVVDPDAPRTSENFDEITDAFKPVVISEHFSSIRRTLLLYFKHPENMDPGTYELRAEGLEDSVGRKLVPSGEDETIRYLHCGFEYNYETTEFKEDDPYERPPMPIEDHSVQRNITIGIDTISAANPDFHIVRTEPENGSIFVEDDTKGRISIVFSRRPGIQFIDSDFIKVQRKQLGPGLNRWEPINAEFSLDTSSAKLNIYVPSDGDEPVYNTDGYDYFLSGYKYRVRLSGDIAAGSGEQ